MPKFPTIPSLISSTRASFKSIPSLSPTKELVCNYETIDNLDVIDDICEDAYKGYSKWSSRPFDERCEILRAAASLVQKNKEQYVEAHMAIGAARPFAEIITQMAYQNIVEHASPISRPDGEVLKSKMSQLAMSIKSPVGPVLSIAPWNAPTVLWARAIAAPLAAGCSVVAKASEKAPITSYLFARDFHKAGVDKEALQVAQFAPKDQPEATKRLIEHSKIKKITFTGSSALGSQLSQIAGSALKPMLLELGGKNVSIITPDADLEKAAESSLFSAWLHNGQICMCLDNCFVHSSVYDDFLKILVKKAQQQSAEKTPLRDVEGADKVRGLVSQALEKGAKVAFGDPKQSSDAFVSPLILTDVDKSMNIYVEETFGPVFSVIKYDTIDGVVNAVNDLRFGLKTSIWSKDVLNAIAVAKKIDTGAVHVNGSTVHDEATVPHGGVGQSGFGRFNNKWGLDEFSFEKVITANP
ncbi:uncharacterized protein CXQ87_003362 [Candidozyma duobushaemuli]|uniref:Aldehyde dehydrogenase domain-containing protein n=2 Tax=Candidozyma TaxID=3303203 RepID=A0ABX8I615_9ASCO|nr:uncharacterized protein CXQ87_003362 [[Candida] duobushaemulonis]PVH15520.1 hypothetical protein CXQ87_003362 [[Candida] duobushaemulonis]QWU88729.1 hypothetical protein CA3LBN_003037 [[Candida] haemuloni]